MLQAPKLHREDTDHLCPEVFGKHVASGASVSLVIVIEGDCWLAESESHSWLSIAAGPQ